MLPGIKWPRVAGIVALLCGVVAVGLYVPMASSFREINHRSGVAQNVASDDDQREIMRSIIEKMTDEGALLPSQRPSNHEAAPQHEKRLFLFSRSATICTESARDSRRDVCATEVSGSAMALMDSRIPKALARDLVASNAREYSVPDPGSNRVVMVEPKDIREMLATRGGWKRFYEMHPNAAGLVSATRAVLSADRMHALIYVEYGCGEVCGTGYLCYMSRAGGSWQVEYNYVLWVS